jgi:tetratricopeptide (TPR) repeat protein
MMKRIIFSLSIIVASCNLFAQSLSGKYILVKESDGQSPKTGATISINFNSNGNFDFKAVMPGTTVTDKGTYKITGSNISISFNEMEQGKQNGPYSLEGGTLILPFKMLKNVKGSSTWQKEGTTADNKNISTAPVASTVSKWADYAKGKVKNYSVIDNYATASSKKVKNNLARGYYTQGVMLFFKKYYMEALYAFAKAAQLQDNNFLYLNNLAMLLMNMDKYGDAISILEELTKSSPTIASPWSNLAVSYFFIGNLPAADNAITQAIKLDPECGGYYYTKGVIEKKKGNAEKAQQNFDKAWDKGYAGKGKEGSPSKNAKSNNNNNKPASPSIAKPIPAPKKSNSQTKDEKLAMWEGHYEAEIISAKSGETAAEANTQFGKDMYQTNISLVTIACVKSFSMDISKRGNISGTGEIMYVYQGGANNPVAGMTPNVLTAQYGGFKTNLKDGAQTRSWSFSGTIDEEGNIEINGLPGEKLDLFNTGEWQKITPWSPLKPDAAGAAMKGPFHLKMTEGKDGKHFSQLDDYLALNDKLIKRVHYQALIVKTNDDIKPRCQGPASQPEAAACPASEFIKTKVALTQADHVTVESSKTFSKGPDGNVQAQTDNAVNVSGEFSKGLFTSSVEFHSDNSYECTIGIGISPEALIKGVPVGLSEKLELIYDSKCGWGVKASAAAKSKLGPAAEGSVSVEGVIFFNAGL